MHLNLFCVQSGSRLFGFIGAGATLGQLFGSLFATVMAWLGPCMFACSAFGNCKLRSISLSRVCFQPWYLSVAVLLLFAALLMEFAARSAKGINLDMPHLPEELSPIRSADIYYNLFELRDILSVPFR